MFFNSVFNSPLSLQRADYFIHILGIAPNSRVIDLGCGDGAFLIRMGRHTQIKGIGVDNSESLIEAANQALALETGASQLTFVCADATQYLDTVPPAEVIVCLGAEYIFGGYRQLLQKAKSKLTPQGKLLVGTVYWKQPPSVEYLALMDGENPHFDLLTTVQIAREEGFIPLGVHRSNDDEWDSFESDHMQERYLTALESLEPDLEKVWKWQEGYLKWGMATMGFCFLVLQSRA